VVIESPDLVAHTYRVWHKLKRTIELAASAGNFMQLRYQGKPMTGFFATIFALQVRSIRPYASHAATQNTNTPGE
jgi:hypothetical protein